MYRGCRAVTFPTHTLRRSTVPKSLNLLGIMKLNAPNGWDQSMSLNSFSMCRYRPLAATWGKNFVNTSLRWASAAKISWFFCCRLRLYSLASVLHESKLKTLWAFTCAGVIRQQVRQRLLRGRDKYFLIFIECRLFLCFVNVILNARKSRPYILFGVYDNFCWLECLLGNLFGAIHKFALGKGHERAHLSQIDSNTFF